MDQFIHIFDLDLGKIHKAYPFVPYYLSNVATWHNSRSTSSHVPSDQITCFTLFSSCSLFDTCSSLRINILVGSYEKYGWKFYVPCSYTIIQQIKVSCLDKNIIVKSNSTTIYVEWNHITRICVWSWGFLLYHSPVDVRNSNMVPFLHLSLFCTIILLVLISLYN